MRGKDKMSKKPEMFKTKKDPELFYYFNAKKEKMFMYRHRYYDVLGKRREKTKQGFKSENEAYRKLLEVKSSILNGDVKEVEDSNITVSEWLDIWYETKYVSWAISTQKDRKRHIDGIIKPLIGKHKLATLDRMTYERRFINKLLKNYAPNSVRLYHKVFKIAVNAAVANKTIKENNFDRISISDKTGKTDNFLSQTELTTLLSGAKDELNITTYSMILFAANTGVRKGEAHGLQWKDINFNKQTIKIEHTRDQDGTRSPKTSNSYRTIYVDDTTLAQLKKYKAWCKKKLLSYGKHLDENDFVFISYTRANPVSQMTINNALNKVINKTGIKRITAHGLRHTHATILLNNKVSIATVAKRLGNTAEEINRTYGHSDVDADIQAVQVFSSAVNS